MLGYGKGGWVGRLAEMASYSDQGAQGPSNLRETCLLAAHCCCVLLLLRVTAAAFLFWQP